MNTTTNITNRTNAYAMAKFLRRATPYQVFERFGQAFPLPTNSTKTAIFRRWEALGNDPATLTLTEGVTPASQTLTFTDVPVTLKQYGGVVSVTDVIQDTNEDPVLNQAVEALGEQAAQTLENVRIKALIAGTNVEYSNGTARTDVNTPISLAMQRRVTRKLKRQMAKHITKVVASTPRFNTENVHPAYVCVVHPDMESDIRGMTGFIDAKDYGSMSPWENEIGAVEGVRYIWTTMMPILPDAGGAKGSMVSTTGTSADVYQCLFIAQDAYGLVPLKGKGAAQTFIVPNVASDSNPLAQRGHVSWKAMSACVILNQAWMVRGEVAVTAL